MTVRRLISMLSVCVVASVTVVAAQPKQPPKADKKGPAVPAKATTPAKAPTPAPPPADAGSGAGSAVQMTEDPPPKDVEGRDENPGAPGGSGEVAVTITAPVKKAKAGYPIEEALRPINLPANMSEVSIGPHAQLGLGGGADGAPYMGSDALRARYGITRRVQIGLTYLVAGIYNDRDVDPMSIKDKQAFHGGKAVGLDVTVLLRDWIGVRVGVPVYIKPVAVSLTLGAPIKFTIGEKFAVGGLDDLLNIKLKRFAPSFYQEATNALGAVRDETTAQQSDGQLRISAFGVYNHKPKTAFIGRTGFAVENFKTAKSSGGGLSYFMRVGANYSPRKYLDLGFSIGFDDLGETGTFGPAGFIAFRI